MWQALRKRLLLGKKFRRQHPIAGFILDFYCHELRLGIEIDGSAHKYTDTKQYDELREKIINKYNIRILRIPNQEVENNLQNVLEKLKIFITSSPRPARAAQPGEGPGVR